MRVISQFVKDLSFENPNASVTVLPGREAPRIEVNFDVQARPLKDNRFEVLLRITADATEEKSGTKVFVVEVLYGGLFDLFNFPAEHVHPGCLIEAPRLLFPFARRIVAELTRDGGFPPLLLDPIDFGELYRQHVNEQQKAGAAPASEPAPDSATAAAED